MFQNTSKDITFISFIFLFFLALFLFKIYAYIILFNILYTHIQIYIHTYIFIYKYIHVLLILRPHWYWDIFYIKKVKKIYYINLKQKFLITLDLRLKVKIWSYVFLLSYNQKGCKMYSSYIDNYILCVIFLFYNLHK